MSIGKPRLFALLMPWGRVGSNLIVAALNNQAGVKVENEPSTALRTRGEAAGLSSERISEQQKAHLDGFVVSVPPGTAAAGLKLAYRSFIDKPGYIRKLAEHDFRLVLLVRENFIKCAVSQQRAHARKMEPGKAKTWSSPWGVAANEPKPGATEIDIAETIRVAWLFESLHFDMMRDVEAAFGDNFKYVTYETLYANMLPTIQDVCEYLELPRLEHVTLKHRKATSDDLREDVLNYEAFAEAVRAKGMGQYL